MTDNLTETHIKEQVDTASPTGALPPIASLDDRFAASLHNLRRQKRMSRPQLAERTGISVGAIQRMETPNSHRTGLRRVSIGEAVVLAEALGVTPGDLLRGVDPPADVCGNGHPRTEQNTYTRRGKRRCRPCNLDTKRASLARKANQAADPGPPGSDQPTS